MRLTVGPLPPAVYWRRRAIVLAGALVVLFLVAQACMSTTASPEDQAGDGADPGDSPAPVAEQTATPSATTPPGPSDAPTGEPASQAPDGDGVPALDPDDESACTDEEMEVTAEAAETEFQQGESVRFTIVIRNDSDRTCSRDVGGGQRELYLREGTGATTKVWSSRDCGAPTGDDVKELAPGTESSAWIAWDGRRSDECDDDQPAGEELEPGEYELVARLGTAYSEPVAITVE